jgi:hypothetical protein
MMLRIPPGNIYRRLRIKLSKAMRLPKKRLRNTFLRKTKRESMMLRKMLPKLTRTPRITLRSKFPREPKRNTTRVRVMLERHTMMLSLKLVSIQMTQRSLVRHAIEITEMRRRTTPLKVLTKTLNGQQQEQETKCTRTSTARMKVTNIEARPTMALSMKLTQRTSDNKPASKRTRPLWVA